MKVLDMLTLLVGDKHYRIFLCYYVGAAQSKHRIEVMTDFSAYITCPRYDSPSIDDPNDDRRVPHLNLK